MKALKEKETIRKYYKYGDTLNTTIIGSPTINDGIISGFNGSNYARLPFEFKGGLYNTWELVVKANFTSFSSYPAVLNVNSFGIFTLGITREGNIAFSLGTSTTAFNIGSFTGTTTLSTGTWYWIKIVFTGSEYQGYISVDRETWNFEGSFSSSTKLGTISVLNFGLRSNVPDSFLDGYIDLKDTYFKANNEDIWHGTFLEECTSEDDYLFFKDFSVYKSIKEAKRTYYKTIFESSTPDTYNLEITNAGTYSIEMYGAGGGWARGGYPVSGHYDNTIATGGSGAGFEGILNLPAGSYTLTVGAGGAYVNGGRGTTGGNTNFNDIISADGATGGYTIYGGTNQSVRVGGVGGTLQIIDSSYITSISKQTNGRNGSSTAVTDALPSWSGATSVYDDTHTGYGAGGGSSHEAVNGYCKIVRISEDSSDYDYYIETSVCKAVKTKR